jgi:periplasmic divalent cation tolerance protein
VWRTLTEFRYNSGMKRATSFRIVLVTCRSLGEARKIARAVVGKKLAACVNIHRTPVESVYQWKGKVETAREYLLVIKTAVRRVAALEKEVLRLHSYETPEFLVMGVAAGSDAYLSWLREGLKAE